MAGRSDERPSCGKESGDMILIQWLLQLLVMLAYLLVGGAST